MTVPWTCVRFGVCGMFPPVVQKLADGQLPLRARIPLIVLLLAQQQKEQERVVSLMLQQRRQFLGVFARQ